MYELRIEEGGRELLRRELPDGQYVLGRSSDNEITIKNSSVSRRHLQLKVTSESVSVTDLGSTNGTNLNGRKLVPYQAVHWNVNDDIVIGSLLINIWPRDDHEIVEPQAEPAAVPKRLRASGLTPFISSGSTQPPTIELEASPVLVGTDASCNLRVTSGNAAGHSCIIQSKGGRILVTNLDANSPVSMAGSDLPVGQETEWAKNQTLQVGTVLLNLSFRQAVRSESEMDQGSRGRRRIGGIWRYGLAFLILSGIVVLCLGALAVVGWQQSGCDGFNLSCIFSVFGGDSDGGSLFTAGGRATPTLQPTTARRAPPTRAETIDFMTATPFSTTEATFECTEGQSLAGGWLEVPFPYQGTEPSFGGSANGFRRISQRSRFGGRINSFF